PRRRAGAAGGADRPGLARADAETKDPPDARLQEAATRRQAPPRGGEDPARPAARLSGRNQLDPPGANPGSPGMAPGAPGLARMGGGRRLELRLCLRNRRQVPGYRQRRSEDRDRRAVDGDDGGRRAVRGLADPGDLPDRLAGAVLDG